MYINKLEVEGFRCFGDKFSIELSSGLNVILGENGAGKTAIISAIRQLFQDSESGRYSISEDDFHCPFSPGAKTALSFSISVIFEQLSPDEKVALLSWTSGQASAILNLRAENKEVRGRYKKQIWGGKAKQSQFDPELMDLIQCIYLPPLRDAEAKLTNGRQSRLSKLLKAINRNELKKCRDSDTPHPLEEQFFQFNEKLAGDKNLTIKEANELIKQQLTQAIGLHFGQSTSIQFAEADFTKIVESLTLLFFPDMSQTDLELYRRLSQNSLGYNNLLYIASILAELTFDDDEERPMLRLLLIEEPEAHLHPQLQIRLLNHLKSVSEKEGGNVQVIVTSHSTVLASSVDINSIIHLSKSPTPIATPLRLCGLSDVSISFINRWLDVTKSNLLFASGVILVEGIAEQMLIPALAREVLKNQDSGKNTLEDLGVSTINLNGIYFKHFMGLYCNLKDIPNEEDQDGVCIPVRCAGITDLDPPKTIPTDDEPKDAEVKKKPEIFLPYDGNIKDGENHALKLVKGINSEENTFLSVSKYKTLEYDLAMEGNNAACMANLLVSLWPTKTGKVHATLTQIGKTDWLKKSSKEKAVAAHEILKRIDDDQIGKGFFAQVLTDNIYSDKVKLDVPSYIKDAILWACKLDDGKVK
ncbi:AAA family ATPase [Vibrio tubiashii]|uniref:AAA family ATPase n=1 Tax=Vibrio tubiashii TaxID=29498 RepID=A0AAE5GSW6_9VIBR|nr:AAA family ATPase [Vibrio tubiashii]NOI82619.1 AAA family ATPase [Vibrio tubiashii]